MSEFRGVAHYNGVFQSKDILDLDVETDYGQAFLSLGTPNGHTVGLTGTVLTGQLKGPAPLQCFDGSGGFISKGLTLISTDTHAAQVPNAGMEFYGCHFDVPVGRRAISSYRNPNVIAQNCTGSGPIHLVAQNLADLAAFNLRNFKGSDLQVNFVENLDESYFVTIFEPRQGGEWSIANGGEIFDGSEQLMSFADGTWEENDILWNSHSSLGPYSWRYEGGKWRRHSLRNKRGHCSFTTFGVSTGHTKLTYTATGLKKRDEVILQLASDPKGLLTQGYCAQDNELTVVIQNNTGAVVTLSDSIWYWTGVRHVTDQL